MKSFKVDKSICVGCGACVQACPYKAIKIDKNNKSVIDEKKCKKCGQCKDICPMNAIQEISLEK